MNTKTVLKVGIFLISISILFLYLDNVSHAAMIGKTKWVKGGNISSYRFGRTYKAPKTSAMSSFAGQAINRTTYSKRYVFGNPKVGREGYFDKVYIPGLETWDGNTGAPKLPFKPIKLLIPYGKTITRVKVTLGSKIKLPSRYLIEPAPEPVPLSKIADAKPTPPDQVIYNSNKAYPAIPCGDAFIQKKDGYSILVLNLLPVEYLPSSGRVAFYKDMNVWFETVPDKTQGADIKPNPDAIDEIRSMVNNPETANSYLFALAAETSLSTPEQYQYVIITTNALRDRAGQYKFQDLISAKQAKGMTAKLVTVEDDIYPVYSGLRPDRGTDNQTKIRNFIIDAYQNHGTRYVLLGGDKNNIPPRMFYVKYGTYTTTMPVDMYYGCLDGTFDNNCNGTYGEPNDGENRGEVDLYAEVFVGRAGARTSSEVSNFVRKTLAYANSSSFYLSTVYMIGEYLWGYDPLQYATPYMEEIRLGSSEHGYTTVGFENSPYKDFFNTYTLYEPSWAHTYELVNVINSGVHILNHLGHASYTYDMHFYTPNSRDANSSGSDIVCLSELTNNNYFFAYSQGCMPGGFDNPEIYRCFAEIVTTMANGAFAVVMNARYGWGAWGSTNGPSQRYNREFWDTFFKDGITNLGRMNQKSKEDNAYRINSSVMRWCYYELNLFGDPELSFCASIKPPLAPSDLSAAVVSATQINLAWKDNSNNENGFKIERKTGESGTFAQIAAVSTNAIIYDDTGLAPGTIYYYRVCASNSWGDSSFSNEINAATLQIPPSAPSNLSAAAVSSTQIYLTWSDMSNNESYFKVYRKTGASGTYALLVNVFYASRYIDTGLSQNTTYCYRVCASNSAGDSSFSNEVNATTLQMSPSAPSNLSAAAVSATQINLAWKDNSNNENGFKIERKTGESGTFAQIAAVSTNATIYDDTGLAPGTIYYYRVCASNSAGDSSFSNEVNAATELNVPDTTPPTGSILINKGDTNTTTQKVTLNLSAIDSGSGMGQGAEMMFYESGKGWSVPEPYATTKAWTLGPGNGTKKIYVQFKDAAGNWSGYYYDTIVLQSVVEDTTPPTGSILINNGAATTTTQNVTLNLSAVDNTGGSGMGQGAQMMFSNDNSTWSTPEAYAATKAWTLTSGNGTKYVYVRFKDVAGNWSNTYYDTITLKTPVSDTTPPTGSIRINNGSSITTSQKVTLNLSAVDNTGGSGMGTCAEMMFSNDNKTWSKPEPYKSTKSWLLTSGYGTKVVYVKFKDAAGNWSKIYYDTIYYGYDSRYKK